MGFTHIGDWVGRGMSDDFREEFRRGNRELPLVTREVLERFWDPTITDTVTVSEQPHVTSSLSVFVNAEPVESCFEKRARLVQFLVELLSLNSTKSIDIN